MIVVDTNVMVQLVAGGNQHDAAARLLRRDASAILGDRIASVSGRDTIAAALEYGLTAHDAEFVVLARMLEVPLATLDRAILDGAPDPAVSGGVLAEQLEGLPSAHSQ